MFAGPPSAAMSKAHSRLPAALVAPSSRSVASGRKPLFAKVAGRRHDRRRRPVPIPTRWVAADEARPARWPRIETAESGEPWIAQPAAITEVLACPRNGCNDLSGRESRPGQYAGVAHGELIQGRVVAAETPARPTGTAGDPDGSAGATRSGPARSGPQRSSPTCSPVGRPRAAPAAVVGQNGRNGEGQCPDRGRAGKDTARQTAAKLRQRPGPYAATTAGLAAAIVAGGAGLVLLRRHRQARSRTWWSR